MTFKSLPNLNLVSNFIPLGLRQLKILFGDVRMNFNIIFLKIEKLSEFLTLLSRLLFSCSVCTPNGGDIIE